MNIIFSTNTLRKATLLSVVFLTLIYCKKEDNIIGSELQKEDLNLSTIDTFTIKTYTKEADSLRADELSTATLGSMNDPELGKTTSSFYTHVRLPVDNVDFTGSGSLTDLILDSVVLSLEYSDYYGNLDPQTFEVYEITEDIFVDSVYFNGRSFTNTGTNLVDPASSTQTPDVSSQVFTASDSFPPQLRLKLDNSFGQKIIDESGNTTVSDNDNFLTFIKGIEVKVNNPGQATNQGGILLFDLLSLNSNVTLYYRDTANKDTLTFRLLMNANCARVNKNEHDYTGTAVASQLLDSTLGANTVFIQGLEGLRTEVELTDVVDLLKDSSIIINKAILNMPVDNSIISFFEPIDQVLIIRNEEGRRLLLPDQTQFQGSGGLDNVGGQWNADDSRYQFNITRYINNVLNGNFPNNSLTIESISSMVTPNRTVLYGHNSAVAQPTLTITYTKY